MTKAKIAQPYLWVVLLVVPLLAYDSVAALLPEASFSFSKAFALSLVFFLGFFLLNPLVSELFKFWKWSLGLTVALTLFMSISLGGRVPDELPPLGGSLAENLLKVSLGKIEGNVVKGSGSPDQSTTLSKGLAGVGGTVDISQVRIRFPSGFVVLRILGNFIYFFFILAACLAAVREIRLRPAWRFSQKNWLPTFLVYLVTAAGLGTVLFFCWERSRTIYIWDLNNYWMRTMAICDQLSSGSVLSTLKSVAASVIGKEYNEVPAVPLALWGKLFGLSRLSYILGIAIVYAAPGLALLTRKNGRGIITTFFLACCLLLFPILISNIFEGAVQFGAFVPMFAIYALYFHPTDRLILKSLLLAFLMIFLTIFRRWYLFSAIGFVIAMAVDCGLEIWRTRLVQNPKTTTFSLVGLVSFATLTLTLGPLFSKILGSNYQDVYSGWGQGIDYFDRILEIVKVLGVAPLTLLFASMIFWGHKDRRLPFMLLTILVPALMLLKIQLMENHQAIGLVVFPTCLGFFFLVPPNRKNKSLAALFLVFGILNTAVFVSPDLDGPLQSLAKSKLFTASRFLPPWRGDTDEILRLNRWIDAEPHKTTNFYVLASSLKFNDETLSWAEVSLGKAERPVPRYNFLRVNHVDKRDGIPLQILTADYLIIPEQIQLSLGSTAQNVIVVPWNLLQTANFFSRHFKKTPEEFQLETGKVFIYQRIRDWNENDKSEFLKAFESKI